MANGPEFDESGDDGDPGPLLPPDDRIWRHPSEVGFTPAPVSDEQTQAARERWLTSPPSRAGAWSAGLVGAVLATGVVLMGSHITTWLVTPKRVQAAPKGAAAATMISHSARSNATFATGIKTFVASSLAVVRTTKAGGQDLEGGGVFVTSSGMVLVPAWLVSGAVAIEVETPDREVFPGRLVGSDPWTGVAVVSIDPDGLELQTLRLAPSNSLAAGTWTAVEWAQPSDATLFVGAVRSVTPVSAGPGLPSLENAVETDGAPLTGHLDGAVIVDGTGALVGFVSAREGQSLIEVPALLAEQVATEIIRDGRVLHATLGIVGVSASGPAAAPDVLPVAGDSKTTLTSVPVATAVTDGVKLISVRPKSPAWAAGLRRGDVIEAVDGETVKSMSSLQRDLYGLGPGTPVHLTVARGSRMFTCATRLKAA